MLLDPNHNLRLVCKTFVSSPFEARQRFLIGTRDVVMEERESSEAAMGAKCNTIHLCFPRVVTGGKMVPQQPMKVVKGDQIDSRCLGVYLGHPAPGVINTGNWTSWFRVRRQADNLSP